MCLIDSAGPPARPTWMCLASGRTMALASFMISSGSVAEKSSVWRLVGSVPTMRWTSGQKPMSIIRSASSSTSTSSRPKSGRRRAHVIHQAAGRRDDDRDTGAQRAILRVHGHAAIHGRARDLRVVGQALDRVFDLNGQLACGCEDQRARSSQLLVGHVEQAVQDRQHERDRLAGAGLRRGQHIVAGQGVGDDGALHGPRLEIAHVLHALEQRRGHVERRERHGRHVDRRQLSRGVCRGRRHASPAARTRASGCRRTAPAARGSGA